MQQLNLAECVAGLHRTQTLLSSLSRLRCLRLDGNDLQSANFRIDTISHLSALDLSGAMRAASPLRCLSFAMHTYVDWPHEAERRQFAFGVQQPRCCWHPEQQCIGLGSYGSPRHT